MLHLGNFLGFSSAAAGGFLWFTVLGALVLLLTGVVVLSPLFTNWLPSLLTWLASYAKNSELAVLMLFGGWIVGAIAFLGVLWLFNVLARAYYNHSLYPGPKRKRKNNQYKSKNPQKSIQKRIGTRHFDPVARRIDADVIITGHTHLPDIYTPEHLPNNLVVNSGSWIMQGNNPHDTFVYIDKRGVCLLQWQDKGGYVSQLESSLL